MANKFKESEQGQKMLGTAKGVLGKTSYGAVGLATADKASKILGSDQGKKSFNDVSTTNNKRDRKLADYPLEENEKIIKLYYN